MVERTKTQKYVVMMFEVADKVIHKVKRHKLIIKNWAQVTVGALSIRAYYCAPNFSYEDQLSTEELEKRWYQLDSALVLNEDEIEFDKQWYREQKINSLLDET